MLKPKACHDRHPYFWEESGLWQLWHMEHPAQEPPQECFPLFRCRTRCTMIATTISKSNMQMIMVARLLNSQENIIHRFLSILCQCVHISACMGEDGVVWSRCKSVFRCPNLLFHRKFAAECGRFFVGTEQLEQDQCQNCHSNDQAEWMNISRECRSELIDH